MTPLATKLLISEYKDIPRTQCDALRKKFCPAPKVGNSSFAVDPSLRNILTLPNNMRHRHFSNGKNTLEADMFLHTLFDLLNS